MQKLILVRVGISDIERHSVSWDEAKRVGRIVHRAISDEGLDIGVAQIFATSEPAQQTALWIIQETKMSKQLADSYDVPRIKDIANSLPAKSWSWWETSSDIVDYDSQVSKTIGILRWRFQELDRNGIIILVSSIPAIWGVWKRLWVDHFPEYIGTNYREAMWTIVNWATYILDFPNN